MIEKVDITRCNSPALVEYLLQLPHLLNEVIAHQIYVGTSYNAVIVAGRDEPGRREQIFTREMRQTQEIENFIELAIEQAREEESAINEMRQSL